MNNLHHFSVVSPQAIIAPNVSVGAFSVIHEQVEIGEGTVIESNVTLYPGVIIGKNCHIFPGVVISANVNKIEKANNSVDNQVIIGDNVEIEPNVTINGNIRIGNHVWIGSSAVIHHGARIGNFCKIFSGAVISSIPQDLKFAGEETILSIGDRTVVREYATLNRGTVANKATIIGSDCLIMAYVHVAHDCIIGNHVILVNGVNMAGHVEVGDYAVISGLSAIHQFVRIGKHAMVSGGSMLGKDVPPYVTAGRSPVQYEGINITGLRRRNFDYEQTNLMRSAYRILFCEGLNFSNAMKLIEEKIADSPEKDEILLFLSCAKTGRGIIKGNVELSEAVLNGHGHL